MEGAPGQTSPPAPAPALARDLTEFLLELSIGIQRAAIYPKGHPILDSMAAAVFRRLEGIITRRSALLIGVSPTQLVIDAIPTDPDHPVLRGLASRLHQHQIGSLRIIPGVTVAELEQLLHTLGVARSPDERPLGLEGPAVLEQWVHLRMMPLSYASLALADGETISLEDSEALWMRLVQIALSGVTEVGEEGIAPATVARAIVDRSDDAAYDQEVVSFLHQVTTAINVKGPESGGTLRLRVSDLLQRLGPETLERLLQLGGDGQRRQRFLNEAVGAVTADAVIDLVVAAATTAEQTVSTSMMRLLNKLATHSQTMVGRQAAMADVALRQQVTQLMEGWSLGETDPEGYRIALDRLAARDPVVQQTDVETPVEPRRVLQMGLEIGTLGAPIWAAVDEMAVRGEMSSLLDLLDEAPASWLRDVITQYAATPGRLAAVLRQRPLPVAVAERLIDRMGIAAVPVLIDLLEETTREEERASVLALLERIGPEVARPVADRLTSVPWATVLPLLQMLGRHPTWSSPYDPAAWSQHPDSAIRREALRQLLGDPARQGAVMAWGLVDPEEGIMRLALAAAMTNCSREVAAVLKMRADDLALKAELRALAVRAFAGYKAPETPPWLLERVLRPSRLLRRAALLPTTPELLAAIEGLVVHWEDHPAAREAIALARASTDPAIRAAASAQRRRR